VHQERSRILQKFIILSACNALVSERKSSRRAVHAQSGSKPLASPKHYATLASPSIACTTLLLCQCSCSLPVTNRTIDYSTVVACGARRSVSAIRRFLVCEGIMPSGVVLACGSLPRGPTGIEGAGWCQGLAPEKRPQNSRSKYYDCSAPTRRAQSAPSGWSAGTTRTQSCDTAGGRAGGVRHAGSPGPR